MKLFEGFVLAGGKSSRMGADKAFLEFGGETFIERAVKTLANLSTVKIVLNKSQTHFIEKLPFGIEYIFDVFEDRGALGGIHAGLKNCENEFALILAIDLPFVTSEAIETLINIALDSNEFSAIVPRQNDKKLQPLCAVYRTAICLPVAEKLLKKNISISVRDFLRFVPTRIVENDELPTHEDLFFNVNRFSDYRHITTSER